MKNPPSLINGLYRTLYIERAEKGETIQTTLEFHTSAAARQFEANIGEKAPQALVVPGQHMIHVTTDSPEMSLSAFDCIESAPARNIRVSFSPAVMPA
ncbi:hypothetical protein [Salinisphaera sp. T31B1]|uniref:hypothetical protein n=1 Tax=Salinisphaera sp. T31B1 TaxID=727963 RepID=UPI003342D9A3